MATITKTLSQVISGFLCLLITIYQRVISPFLGPRCRFYPSCSCYAQQALTTHGVIKGSYLAIKRIARCHPLCEGGIDPVPTIKGKHHG